MINQWLCVLFQMSVGPVMGFAMESMQMVKQNKIKKWMRIAVWIVFCTAMAVSKVFGASSTGGIIAVWGLWLAMLAAGYYFFYEGRFLNQIAIGCLLIVALVSAESACFATVWLRPTEYLSMNYRQIDMVAACILDSIVSNIVLFFVSVLWLRLVRKKRMPRGVWVFVLMPLFLVIPMLYYYREIMKEGGGVFLFHLIPTAGALVLNLLMICVLFNQAEKDELKKELLRLMKQSELEQSHYRNVEAHRKELDTLRRDYDNRLSDVLALIQGEQIEDAKQEVTQLLSKVAETREYPYCGIPIVNAILAEKDTECRKYGIELRVDMLFEENIEIDAIDLCSVFANLLDNAIRACTHLSQEKSRCIELSVRVQGDYMAVRCDNPAIKAPGERPEGSGYGMKILRDIAKRYNGDFRAEFCDGIFIARMVLLAGKDTQ